MHLLHECILQLITCSLLTEHHFLHLEAAQDLELSITSSANATENAYGRLEITNLGAIRSPMGHKSSASPSTQNLVLDRPKWWPQNCSKVQHTQADIFCGPVHVQARGGEFYAWEGKEWSGEEGREMPVVQEKSFAARPLRISCLQIFLSWPTGISWSRSGRGSGRSSRRWTLSKSQIDRQAGRQPARRISLDDSCWDCMSRCCRSEGVSREGRARFNLDLAFVAFADVTRTRGQELG